MKKEKVIRLAKKLKALADGGVEGEAKSARKRLDVLLLKHGMTLDEIGEVIREFEMTTLNESSSIMEKIIKSVAPKAKIHSEKNKSKLIIKVALSDIEYKEIKQKYAFFWKVYNEERKLLLAAFFNKHFRYFIPEVKLKTDRPLRPNAPPPPNLPRDIDESEDIVPMNMEEIVRMSKMIQALKDVYYMKTSKLIDRNYDDKE